MEKVKIIRERLKAAQDKQKRWAHLDRRPLEFEVGDFVFLKISPTKGVIRFGSRGKLSPRFIGPFEILERVGEVVYHLTFPPSLDGMHDIFHIFQLRKYVRDDSHVLDHFELELRPDMTCTERPMAILDRTTKVLKNQTIPLVLVSWGKRSPRKRHGNERTLSTTIILIFFLDRYFSTS